MYPSLRLPGRLQACVPSRWRAAVVALARRCLAGPVQRAGLALALAALLLLGAWQAGGATWFEQQALPMPGCDALRQPCTAHFSDGTTLTLQLVPQAGSTGGALRVAVQTGGFGSRSVGLDLDGETMAMGPNHLELQRSGDGRWQGDAALSACLSGRMAWVATLRARSGLGERVARLRFVSGEPAP
jgi:hypothetical protein